MVHSAQCLPAGQQSKTPTYLQGRGRSSIGVGQSRHGDVNRLQTRIGHTPGLDEADHLVLGAIRRAVTIDEHAIGVRFGHAYHANGKLARGAIRLELFIWVCRAQGRHGAALVGQGYQRVITRHSEFAMRGRELFAIVLPAIDAVVNRWMRSSTSTIPSAHGRRDRSRVGGARLNLSVDDEK